MKTIILFFVCLICFSLNSFAQNENKVLLNKTYKVRAIGHYGKIETIGHYGKPLDTKVWKWKDKIIFKNNKIHFNSFSKDWESLYFPCTISVDSITHIINFTSEITYTAGYEKLTGTITGDTIEGTIKSFTYDGVIILFSFSGKIK
jgi:hypothetical protein